MGIQSFLRFLQLAGRYVTAWNIFWADETVPQDVFEFLYEQMMRREEELLVFMALNQTYCVFEMDVQLSIIRKAFDGTHDYGVQDPSSGIGSARGSV